MRSAAAKKAAAEKAASKQAEDEKRAAEEEGKRTKRSRDEGMEQEWCAMTRTGAGGKKVASVRLPLVA